MGDFNFSLLNPQSSTKISYLCTQFSFYQAIKKPTHFAENSSSVIYIILVNLFLSSSVIHSLTGIFDTIVLYMEYSNLLSLNAKRSNDIFGIISGEIMFFYEARHCWWTGIPFRIIMSISSENITSTILSISRECFQIDILLFAPKNLQG